MMTSWITSDGPNGTWVSVIEVKASTRNKRRCIWIYQQRVRRRGTAASYRSSGFWSLKEDDVTSVVSDKKGMVPEMTARAVGRACWHVQQWL